MGVRPRSCSTAQGARHVPARTLCMCISQFKCVRDEWPGVGSTCTHCVRGRPEPVAPGRHDALQIVHLGSQLAPATHKTARQWYEAWTHPFLRQSVDAHNFSQQCSQLTWPPAARQRGTTPADHSQLEQPGATVRHSAVDFRLWIPLLLKAGGTGVCHWLPHTGAPACPRSGLLTCFVQKGTRRKSCLLYTSDAADE